jgi:hypothetical protein
MQHTPALERRVIVAAAAAAAADDKLHTRMLASEDAAAMRAALGLKSALVTGDVEPVRHAMAACV